ncbi:N-acetyltransferase B complex non catalytic subunit-domain-containing protein [Phlyctochytrium arcticum]|nr:N-acetyltransferase B complex non catalytic subunit-domain-containing protein [Phlyctochytrium arcticum]
MASLTDVSERKLRPIYEALDSWANKQALQLCDKALKKQPDALILKALKALSFDRLGRTEDALALCAQVKASKTADEGILQAVTMVYRAHHCHQDIVDIYASAFDKDPKNEELANHWFMGLVRGDDRQKMQQAAMRLQKTFRDNRYLFWTIMTIWLRAKDDPKGPTGMMVTLAERMMVRAHQEGKVDTFEILQLYVDILTYQSKYDEALTLIESELGAKLCKVAAERKRLMVGLAQSSRKWEKVLEWSREVIRMSIDDWLSWQNYLEAVLETQDQGQRDNYLTNFKTFVLAQQDKAASEKHPKRAPFLAELELQKRTDPTGSVDLILSYIARFGSTISCFDDVRVYIEALSDAARSELAKKLTGESENLTTSAGVRQAVTKAKAHFLCIKLETATDVHELSNKYLAKYKETIPLGAKLDERELQPGDEYLILAAQALIYLHQETKAAVSPHLLQAGTILEYGLQRSKFNYQMKLLLVRIYAQLGAVMPLLDHASTLDIKQIQHDTVSYFITHDIEMLGAPEKVVGPIMRAMTIYSSNERETPEMIVQAFKFCTFSKIEEFIRFRDRLRHSLQRMLFQGQLCRIELLRRGPSLDGMREYLNEVTDPELDASADGLGKLSDNRDRTLLPDWRLSNVDIAESISGKTFPPASNWWIKVHMCIPKLLKLVILGAEKEQLVTVRQSLQDAIRCAEAEKDQEEQVLAAQVLYDATQCCVEESTSETDVKPLQTALNHLKDIRARLPDPSSEPQRSLPLSACTLKTLTLVLEASMYLQTVLSSIAKATRSSKTKTTGKTGTVAKELADQLVELKTWLEKSNDLINTFADAGYPLDDESWKVDPEIQTARSQMNASLVRSWRNSLTEMGAVVGDHQKNLSNMIVSS